MCDRLQQTRTFCRGDDPDWDCTMFHRPLKFLRISWPAGLVALPFGTVYCLLLCLFPDSIEAYAKVRVYTDFSGWGGIETLFALNSAILGWLSVVVAERRTSVAGFILLLMILPWCFASICGGFALASLWERSFSDAVWDMLACSLVSVVGASALRAYLCDML